MMTELTLEKFEEAAEILTGIFAPFTLPEEAIDTERKLSLIHI